MFLINGEYALASITASDNVAEEDGGALLIYGSAAMIEDASFSDNVATEGSGIYVGHSDLTIKSSSFTDNYATSRGSALRTFNTVLAVDRTGFTGNEAGIGAGTVYVTDGEASFTRSAFHNNLAAQGGALYASASVVHVLSCSFSSKRVDRPQRKGRGHRYQKRNSAYSRQFPPRSQQGRSNACGEWDG